MVKLNETPIEYKYHDIPFLVYSEYLTNNPENYAEVAKVEKKYVIGGAREKDCVSVSMYSPDGEFIGRRYKKHLTQGEIETGTIPANGEISPFVIEKEKIEVLPIICYELLFPEDWLHLDIKPYFITHYIGFPMYDKIQDEAWFAMQKVLSLRFKCDVVVACGEGREGINNSGIIFIRVGNHYASFLSINNISNPSLGVPS